MIEIQDIPPNSKKLVFAVDIKNEVQILINRLTSIRDEYHLSKRIEIIVDKLFNNHWTLDYILKIACKEDYMDIDTAARFAIRPISIMIADKFIEKDELSTICLFFHSVVAVIKTYIENTLLQYRYKIHNITFYDFNGRNLYFLMHIENGV